MLSHWYLASLSALLSTLSVVLVAESLLEVRKYWRGKNVKRERLTGRSVLVTGGNGAIGAAIIAQCAQQGAIVTATTRHPRLEPDEPNVHWMSLDVCDPRAIRAVFAATVERTGSLDVLITSAGVQVESPIDETTDEQFEFVFGTNVRGVFNCCRAAVIEMKRQGGGAIINIGSTSAFAADHFMPVYNASKAAVHALTRSIAVDHGEDGIRCNAVAPGWIKSPMADAAFGHYDNPELARDTARRLHPVGRLGTAQDVANLVVWLASDQASFVSGTVFTIDGGLTAQNPIPSQMLTPSLAGGRDT